MIVEVNDSNIENVLSENKDKVVLMDFWAGWCGPCRMYGTTLEKFSDENPDVVIVKVNIDLAPEASAKYAIRSIPTSIVFEDGEQSVKLPGALSKEKLIEIFKL
tara:strand:- start:138 stop:449 length:312 start_codon:yes stop_codon:yes gene_type:complete